MKLFLDLEVPAGERGEPSRLFYTDAIRAYAIVSVVFLHVVSPIVGQPSTVSRAWWWMANVYDAFLRPCVPLFVMVSGLLLLDPRKADPLGLFFKKRMMKVLVPFLFWGVVHLIARSLIQAKPLSPLALLRELVTGPIYVHFWFLYVIFGLYLAAPILRIYVAHAPVTLQRYFLILWFVGASILPFIRETTGVSIGIPLVVATQYVGYFVLGPFLRDRVLAPRGFAPAVALFVGCGLFTAVATGAILARAGRAADLFYGFLSPNVVIMSVSAFLVLRSLPWQRMMLRHRLVSRTITQLSALSFGIYIVHYLLVEFLREGRFGVALPGSTWPPLIAGPVTAVIALAVSAAVVVAVRAVPFGRYVLP